MTQKNQEKESSVKSSERTSNIWTEGTSKEGTKIEQTKQNKNCQKQKPAMICRGRKFVLSWKIKTKIWNNILKEYVERLKKDYKKHINWLNN